MHNEGETVAVCELCLKSCECAPENVEVLTLHMLRILGLELNSDISGRPVICRTCSEHLQKCFDFKTICTYTEDCISSFRNDGDSGKLDLKEIYLRKRGNESIALSGRHTICRLCMEMVETGCYIALNDEAKDTTTAKIILGRCFSELDLNISKNPVICMSCNGSLRSYFDFAKNWLDMENKIKNRDIEEINNKPREESKKVLQLTAEYISNCKEGGTDIQIRKNCDEHELHNEIKLKLENLTRRESQQLHIKREINEHNEVDVEVEKLSNIVEKNENEQTCETEMKCEKSVEAENEGINIKHEEINIKTEDEDTARFQDNLLIVKDAPAVAIHQCKVCKFKTKHRGSLNRHMLTHKKASKVATYSCAMCTYQTEGKGNLKDHMLMYGNASEVTTHSCGICTYKAKQKRNSMSHFRMHLFQQK